MIRGALDQDHPFVRSGSDFGMTLMADTAVKQKETLFLQNAMVQPREKTHKYLHANLGLGTLLMLGGLRMGQIGAVVVGSAFLRHPDFQVKRPYREEVLERFGGPKSRSNDDGSNRLNALKGLVC